MVSIGTLSNSVWPPFSLPLAFFDMSQVPEGWGTIRKAQREAGYEAARTLSQLPLVNIAAPGTRRPAKNQPE